MNNEPSIRASRHSGLHETAAATKVEHHETYISHQEIVIELTVFTPPVIENVQMINPKRLFLSIPHFSHFANTPFISLSHFQLPIFPHFPSLLRHSLFQGDGQNIRKLLTVVFLLFTGLPALAELITHSNNSFDGVPNDLAGDLVNRRISVSILFLSMVNVVYD
jgi:hypothetical protein